MDDNTRHLRTAYQWGDTKKRQTPGEFCDSVKRQIYISGENLTDTDYEQKKGYPMPGISGMMGVKLTV